MLDIYNKAIRKLEVTFQSSCQWSPENW